MHIKSILKHLWCLFEKIFYFIVKEVFHLPLDDGKMESMLQFIKFSLVGVSNTVVHYCIYLVCTVMGLHYMVANFCAFTISVFNSFYWNNRYVFKEEREQRFWLFALVKTYIAYGVTGLLLNSILLYIEVDICHMNALLAPIMNLLITIPLNFVMNKLWAYKKKT